MIANDNYFNFTKFTQNMNLYSTIQLLMSICIEYFVSNIYRIGTKN